MSDDASFVSAPSAPFAGYVQVALDVPLEGPFDYSIDRPAVVGQRVIVPFGRQRLVGVITGVVSASDIAPALLKPIDRLLDDLPPLSEKWLALTQFAADYYQRPVGEVMLPALPLALRRVSAYEGKRSGAGPALKRIAKRKTNTPSAVDMSHAPSRLNPTQAEVAQSISQASGFKAFLLHGVTGSGKTEVYLSAAADVLAKGGRVLFLVPEINLTPQFAAALQVRLGHVVAPEAIAVLHSGLADGQRLDAWLRAQDGTARIVLGTRLAIFTPMPQISLIVVDEEHDASYKQQEGLRYSARDLAIWRARQESATVVLGSATPSLESWLQAQRGHYQLLVMPERVTKTPLPTVQLVDTRRLVLNKGLAPQLIKAIEQTLQREQQVLIFLNRRGYAPVLHCASCGWVSQCDHCTAFFVLHQQTSHRMRLHCHHCGAQRSAPVACPTCGDQDLQPMGRGTQRLEEHIGELFPQARLARIDADSTRLKGSAQVLFDKVHAGEVDILIGTQMVSKGHDFSRLGLVGVLNADATLFSQDFRAPERLFAQLMQVAGRAGRAGQAAHVLIQTGYPEQSVYQAVKRHDFDGFASALLAEREAAGLPPYAYQALLTAEAIELQDALNFLQTAREAAQAWLADEGYADQVTLYDPIPLRVVRVAQVCRAQLLLESSARLALHRLLRAWMPSLGARHGAGKLRWQLEVDPLEI
jgi:primosomal protein N' (replication factor Y) (superfamily II helicase)